MNNNLISFLILILLSAARQACCDELSSLQLHVIPYPQKIEKRNSDFIINGKLTLVLDNNPTSADIFTTKQLILDLKNELNIVAEIGSRSSVPFLRLTHLQASKNMHEQGYQIISDKNGLIIRARSEAGLFYGTQTLKQLIFKIAGHFAIPGLIITDWPDIDERAIHYDTKHHQDKSEYVKSFIKDLSRYKVNMLVWEWEDKFEYPSHPEIGAPGAFTMKEMQELTLYARQFHIQIVPLVQGLGHASYILKWPHFKSLREIDASNWEFCPLKADSYAILFDLWNDAIKATPGSEYIHIGTDETYELGVCKQCRIQAEISGKNSLLQMFINKSAKYLVTKGRKVMVWQSPMGWKTNDPDAKEIEPAKGLVFREHYNYTTPGYSHSKDAIALGYQVFVYDPNPGVAPIMVPYNFEISEEGEIQVGSLEKSKQFLSQAAGSGLFKGMISAAWDDDDLHNQMWMMHFINAATWSWNGSKPTLDEFRESFLASYYGNYVTDMDELFKLLNEGAYYFANTMERNVWHLGEIGQTHLPDLPRGDALEYDPFWNTQYKDKVVQSQEILAKMERAIQIIDVNKCTGIRNAYDFEIFRTTADLVKHTCLTYLDLSNLEYTIKDAHVNRFVDYNVSLNYLLKARDIVEINLKRRDSIFTKLVITYQETRLPRGMSTPDKTYFWQQDRARHFGFRRPDMSFLIYDEQLLDMEGYLEKLKSYIEYFKSLN